MDYTPEQIIRIRGYIVVASMVIAFFAKSMVGGFFAWLFAYTLLTTIADQLMIHRFGVLLNAGSYDVSTEQASTTDSLDPDQMENVVNRAIQESQSGTPAEKSGSSGQITSFVQKYGVTAAQLNTYFETQASVRLWCFGIAALHAGVGYLVHLNYQSMFVQIYFALRIGCFLYGIFIRTVRATEA